jgi:hypothetical protein
MDWKSIDLVLQTESMLGAIGLKQISQIYTN